MLEAPKKPTTPSVRSSTYCASSGSASGPPWQSTITSGFTRDGGVAHRLDLLDALVERLGRLRADRALGGQAHVRDEHVGAGLGHRRRAARGRTRRARSAGRATAASRIISTSSAVAHPGLLEVRPEGAVDQADGREVLHAREAGVAHLAQEARPSAGTGRCRRRPASTGVSRTTGSTSRAHLHHDRVGVAVGHQAGQRAAAGHPVAAGVVDDDQVGAAGLGALGRQARCPRRRR